MKWKQTVDIYVIFLSLTWALTFVSGLANVQAKQKLSQLLQRSSTPSEVLQNVGKHLNTENDDEGYLSSLVLIRLSKQMVHEDNIGKRWTRSEIPCHALQNVIDTLASIDWGSTSRSIEAAVEGTKAASVISRLFAKHPSISCKWSPLIKKWHSCSEVFSSHLAPSQLSGVKWAFDSFQVSERNIKLPSDILLLYKSLNLPFRIRPGFLASIPNLNVQELRSQVDFQVDQIRTTNNRFVNERRQTAWEGDDNVLPFAYSGKEMARRDWSPLVRDVRDELFIGTKEFYDGCLINLYPDGGSGMRYHADPDQGELWGYETAVVSLGATRKFAFRGISGRVEAEHQKNDPHVFTLMHGDVTEMFRDCQEVYQHCVKKADFKSEHASRASLVFKKTLFNGPETIDG